MNLEGKNIILTGASSGIGKEILHSLSSYPNIRIIAIARHIDNIPKLEGIIFPFSVDVSTKEGIDKAFDFAKETIGSIDLFIANAGFAYLEKLDKPDWQHIENIYNLNVFSPIYSLEKLVAESGSKQIVFACTISGAGLASLPAYSLYCSTKAALHHFIQTYRYEQPKNLQLSAIYPVATQTGFFDKAAGEKNTPIPFPKQDPKVVAKKIIRGIVRGRKNIYPSIVFRLSYPLGRTFPFFLKIYSLSEKAKVKKWLRF